MNISLISLQVKKFGNSPYLSLQNVKNTQICKSKFSYFSNFVFHSRFQQSISFSSTQFKNGLSTAVKLENQVNSFKRYWSRQEFSTSHAIFTDCNFDSIDTRQTNGSAIISCISLSLYNCYFHSIFGNFGAIYSIGNTNIEYCSFSECTCKQAGALFQTSLTLSNVSILNSAFYQVHADELFGAIFIETWGTATISTVNSTKTLALNCVGFGQASFSHVKVSYFNARQSESCYNGCFSFVSTQSVDVTKSNFIKCSHRSNNPITASAILITNTPRHSVISESSFIDNVVEGGYIICVNDEKPITIIDCCLTKAIRMINHFFITENVKFKNGCYEISNDEMKGVQIGFSYVNEKEGKKRIINSKFDLSLNSDNKQKNFTISKSIQFSILLSIIVCFAKWFFSHYIKHSISFKRSKNIV